MIGIYKITIEEDNYIGQSENILERWRHHLSLAFGETKQELKKEMYQKMREAGIEKISFSILKLCNKEQLNFWEDYYIKEYQGKECKSYNDSKSYGSNSLTLQEREKILDEILNSDKTLEQIAKNNNTSIYIVKSISRGDTFRQENLVYPLRKKEWSFYCQGCGIKINSGKKYCKSCAAKNRNGNKKPEKEILQKEVFSTNFAELGRKYSVDKSTISKWLKSYNLPYTRKDIQKYNLEEWLSL